MNKLSGNDFAVLWVLKNHKSSTTKGISQITLLHRISVLRSLSILIKQGLVKKQKGATINGDEYPNARFYKLKKTTIWKQPELQLINP